MARDQAWLNNGIGSLYHNGGFARESPECGNGRDGKADKAPCRNEGHDVKVKHQGKENRTKRGLGKERNSTIQSRKDKWMARVTDPQPLNERGWKEM